jgi:hypothetical protein
MNISHNSSLSGSYDFPFFFWSYVLIFISHTSLSSFAIRFGISPVERIMLISSKKVSCAISASVKRNVDGIS